MDFDWHDLDISAMELRVLQSTDPTLERARNERKNDNYFFEMVYCTRHGFALDVREQWNN